MAVLVCVVVVLVCVEMVVLVVVVVCVGGGDRSIVITNASGYHPAVVCEACAFSGWSNIRTL